MKKHLLLCSFFLLTGIPLTAQVGWKCGTPSLKMPLASQIHLKNSIAVGSDTATLYIPVTVNIVGNDNGSGHYSFSQTMEALCKLQADFNPYGFHFYLEHLKYINSSAFYDMTPRTLTAAPRFSLSKTTTR